MDSLTVFFFGAKRRWTIGAAALFLVVVGCRCNWDPDPSDTPPQAYGYHYEPVEIRVHATNWEREPLGVQDAHIFAWAMYYVRPGSGWTLVFSRPANVHLRRMDTTTVICTTSAQHLTGYQLKYRGDTTRLCVLDSRGTWSNQLRFSGDSCVLATGETLGATPASLGSVSDTLTPGSPLVLEIEFDMSGLLTRDTVSYIPRLNLHEEYMSCRQVR